MPIELTQALVEPLLPERPANGHKGTFGHVFIIAASRGFTGAAKLTSEGAGRAGAGLVTLGIPETLNTIIAAGLLETMTFSLPATTQDTLSRKAIDPALEFAKGKSAVVIGPGMSQHPDAQHFVREFVPRCPAPLVIDADALNALSEDLTALGNRESPCIVTPHPGEMARLANLSTKEVQANREGTAVNFSERYHCTTVLKGHGTLIADESGACYSCPLGNSGMGTGGTGDVLAGIIGGLLAQGMSCTHAGMLGTFLHGLAGDFAAEAMTQRAMLARDLIAHLPHAWRALEESK